MPFVTALEQIKVLAGVPFLDLDPRGVLPGKGTASLCLVASIDLHSVVSTGTTQASTLAAVAHIFECSRINQKMPPISNQTDAQRIRMPVTSIPPPQGPSIDKHLLARLCVRHQVEA